MNEITVIKDVSIGECVDARRLHEFLGSRRDFSNWIKVKVLKNEFFQENRDFVLLNKLVEQTIQTKLNLRGKRGGHNKKDWLLTIKAAKKVAMEEHTERGDEVRDYFIECEDRLKAQVTPKITMSTLQMISHLALEMDAQNKVIEEQSRVLKEQEEVLNEHSGKLIELATNQEVLLLHHDKKAELQDSLPEVNEKSIRARINQITRSYTNKNHIEFWETWGKLYTEFYYRNGVNLKVKAKNRNLSIMDYLEKNELLEDVLALAIELFC